MSQKWSVVTLKCRCGRPAIMFLSGTDGTHEPSCGLCVIQGPSMKKELNICCPHCGKELQISLGVYL